MLKESPATIRHGTAIAQRLASLRNHTLSEGIVMMKPQPATPENLPAGIFSINEKPTCLRCNTELTEYRPTRFTFLPYGISRAHAMVVCPKCGHVEFLSKDSPLLNEMEAIASDGGDDD